VTETASRVHAPAAGEPVDRGEPFEVRSPALPTRARVITMTRPWPDGRVASSDGGR